MDFEAPYTPNLIQENDKRLEIPIYQRLFVWDSARISRLLEDLRNAYSSDTDAPYPIGVMTVWEKDGKWDVVDGQQRFTFLTLLGCEFVARCGNEDIKAKWKAFVLCDKPSPHLRIEYNGRDEDRDDIKRYLDNEIGKIQNTNFLNFAETFDIFLKKCKRECDGFDLDKYAKYCFNQTSFLINGLPRWYTPFDLNLYFEKMNSTGKQLAPVDIVKGRWFARRANEWNGCLNFDNPYDPQKYNRDGSENGNEQPLTVKDICEKNHEELLKQGKPSDNETTSGNRVNRLVMRPEVLLLHVLELCIKDADRKEFSRDYRNVIRTFEFFMKQVTVDLFMETLSKYRLWLDGNIIYLKDNGEKYEYALRADKDDTEADEKDSTVEPREAIQYQSMLYVSSDEYQQWVLDAYRQCKDGQPANGLLSILREQDLKRHALDEDKLCYPLIDRYWFWKLDYLLWEYFAKNGKDRFCEHLKITLNEKEISAIRQYRFRRNISIEHLHPQSKGGDEWGTRDAPDAVMHQFGNLALMSKSANSAQSNDEIDTKFLRVSYWLSGNRLLESIKLLVMFKQADGKEAGWTPEMAQAHCETMVELLRDSTRIAQETVTEGTK